MVVRLWPYADTQISPSQAKMVQPLQQIHPGIAYPITLKPTASIYALSFLESGRGYEGFQDFNPFNANRSAGAGVRIFMPAFGLLGIDFGYGFDSINQTQQTPNGWETHFIIGQQF